jgi:hypothetical protein
MLYFLSWDCTEELQILANRRIAFITTMDYPKVTPAFLK